MSELNTHIDLFTNSGCLTRKALKGYISDTVSDLEKDQVQSHLDRCELCSDALEGLQLITDPGKLDSIVSEINENLKKTLPDSDKTQSVKFRTQTRLYYFAAAASILVLIGVFSYFKFYLQNQNTDISILTENPKQEFGEDVKFPTEEYSEDESPKQIVKESNPISPIEIQRKESDNTGREVDGNSTLEAEPEMEITMESLSDEDIQEETVLETLNETVMGKSNTIAISEEQTPYVVDGISISEDVIDPEGIALEDKIAVEETQYSSAPAKIRPAMAKKGRSTLSSEGKGMIEADSLSDSTVNVFTVVEAHPEYPGGMEALHKYLKENVSYPDSAKNLGIQGTVFVSLVVKKSGKVDNAKIERGIGGGCDEEALRIVKSMPEWIPGQQRGKPVNTQIVLPIKFKLD